MQQSNEAQRQWDKKQAGYANIQDLVEGCSRSLQGTIGQLNQVTPANYAGMENTRATLEHMQQLIATYLKSVAVNSVEQTPVQSPFVAQQPASSPLRLVPPVFDMEQETGLTAPAVELEQSPEKKRKHADEDNALPDTTVVSPTKRPRISDVPPPKPVPKPKKTLALIKLAHNDPEVKGMIEDIEEDHVRKRKPKIQVDAEECSNGDIRMTVSTFTIFKMKGSAIGIQQAPVQQNVVDIEPKQTRSGHIYGS